MKTAQDILDSKGNSVFFIEPLESVHDALQMMHDRNVGALLVMIEEYLVGIVSERDYARKMILDHKMSKQTKVSEIMTRDVVTVSPNEDIQTCISLMKQHHIRHLPVASEGKVKGMLSLRDLFLEYIEDKQELTD
jgi:CBS domain-containing protein